MDNSSFILLFSVIFIIRELQKENYFNIRTSFPSLFLLSGLNIGINRFFSCEGSNSLTTHCVCFVLLNTLLAFSYISFFFLFCSYILYILLALMQSSKISHIYPHFFSSVHKYIVFFYLECNRIKSYKCILLFSILFIHIFFFYL